VVMVEKCFKKIFGIEEMQRRKNWGKEQKAT
jgi:hypothetical protein